MDEGWTEEDARALVEAIERAGGVEDVCDSEGRPWKNPYAVQRALKALGAASRSRARRESREAMAALPLRVAAHLARPSGTPEMHS